MERVKRIQLRVSAAEHEQFLELARRRRMRLADLVRITVLHEHPPVIPSINRDALAELHRIGSNLNQLARHANTTGEAPDLLELRQQVSALRLALTEAQPGAPE